MYLTIMWANINEPLDWMFYIHDLSWCLHDTVKCVYDAQVIDEKTEAFVWIQT